MRRPAQCGFSRGRNLSSEAVHSCDAGACRPPRLINMSQQAKITTKLYTCHIFVCRHRRQHLVSTEEDFTSKCMQARRRVAASTHQLPGANPPHVWARHRALLLLLLQSEDLRVHTLCDHDDASHATQVVLIPQQVQPALCKLLLSAHISVRAPTHTRCQACTYMMPSCPLGDGDCALTSAHCHR